MWIGCHADSHEYARWFGDGIAVRRDSYSVDWSGPAIPQVRALQRGAGQPLARRTLMAARLLRDARGVAKVAGAAGLAAGLSREESDLLRRAGHLHDLGRIGVSNQVWSKPGPLSAADWERVRLHPYLTVRILTRVGGLAAEAQLAGNHHERQDGSGYPRGLAGGALSGAFPDRADHALTRVWRPWERRGAWLGGGRALESATGGGPA